MIRPWIGIALLAGSWQFASGGYHAPNWTAWAVLAAAGTLLLIGPGSRRAGWLEALLSLAALTPPVLMTDWPNRAAPLALACGVLAAWGVGRWSWGRAVGRAGLLAGVILAAQLFALWAYQHGTARCHELPRPLPAIIGWLAERSGAEVGVDGSTLAAHSMRLVHPLGATWELLCDPASVAFAVGGIAWIFARRCASRRNLLNALIAFAALLAVWLPLRAAALVGAYLHRVLRTDYDGILDAMNQFWSPSLNLILLAGPVLLAWRFTRDRKSPESATTEPASSDAGNCPVLSARRLVAPILFAVAVALFSLATFWNPPGERKPGRVAVDETRSRWEPTTRPMDTEWYGQDSGYNYACLYDYASRFYEMSRITQGASDAALAELDVLIVKTPTIRYAPEEIEAIRRFVNRGGGLVLIGEHTDVFHTGNVLNEIAERFGFAFRYDCLFGIDSFFEQRWSRPPAAHPIVQHIPAFDFAVSCSIDPGASRGRAVIVGSGLKSLGADYHVSNFYPQAENRPQMRYGSFVQVWTTTHGQGRVVAFTDSTIFSNFCLFDEGKSELALGLVEWANRRSRWDGVQGSLAAVAAALAGMALLLGWRWGASCVLSAALGWLAWTGTIAGVEAHHRAAMPPPAQVRPMTRVAIDRTLCGGPLPKNGFINGQEDGYGIFERWILRLGYFTARRTGPAVFDSQAILLFRPTGKPDEDYRRRLERYVRDGGCVLVIDSADSTGSTADSLLAPFGLRVNAKAALRGSLEVSPSLRGGATTQPAGAAIAVDKAVAIEGGEPLARVNGTPVAAVARHGRGTVIAAGLGHLFADTRMGFTGDIVPDARLRRVYDLQFALLRRLLAATPTTSPEPPR